MKYFIKFLISVFVIVLNFGGIWFVCRLSQKFDSSNVESKGSYIVKGWHDDGTCEVLDKGEYPASMNIEELKEAWLRHDMRLTYSKKPDPNDIGVLMFDNF